MTRRGRTQLWAASSMRGDSTGPGRRPSFVVACAACALLVGVYALGAEPAVAQTADQQQARDCFQAGEKAYLAGQLEEAKRSFECAYERMPSAELAWNLARVAERMGDVERGVQYFREYLSRAHVSARERRAIEARIQKLHALRARQASVPKSDVELQAALSEYARSFFQRGVRLYRRGVYQAAAAAFSAALQASGAAELHYNLALCAERLSDWAEAQDHYRAYLTAFPDASDRQEISSHLAELASR